MIEQKESEKELVVFDSAHLAAWSARKMRKAAKAEKAAATMEEEWSEQILLNEILRVCLQKAADLLGVYNSDGLVITMNDCVTWAVEAAIAKTAEQYQFYDNTFNFIDAPVINGWNSFRFTCRFSNGNLKQEVGAALTCWRRMSGYNVSSSVFINFAIVLFLQHAGFVFYDLDGQEIADAFKILAAPESQLGKIELCLGNRPQVVFSQPAYGGRFFPAVFYPVGLPENTAEETEEWEDLALRLPLTLYRVVNMWASACQLEATERLRQYDPAAGIAVQTDDRAWDYSFEEAVRMAIDIYIRLEEYAQAKQKPVWGETWQTVLPGSGLPEELAPKTTAHPEKNIEYVRVIPRVAKAKLAKWRQYSGSDNNKAMMALTTLLQLYGLYVSDAADDNLPPLQVMSLWQYFRMAKGHELYVLRERDLLHLRDDRMTNPIRILDELFYRYDQDYFIGSTTENEEVSAERVVKRKIKR